MDLKRKIASMEKKPTIELVKKIKSDLSTYRKQFEKNRDEEEDAYYGDIWKNTSKHRPYENEIFQIIEGEVPILSDSMPGVAPISHDLEREQQIKILGKSIEWVLKDQDFEIDYPCLIRESLKAGDGWLHCYYDHNADDGQGRHINEFIHWKQVYLSGIAPKLDDCPKARIELDRTRDWLKSRYKKYAEEIDKIKGDKSDKDEDHYGRETYDVGNIGPKKRVRPNKYKDEDTLCLVKTFIKDYSITSIPQEMTDEDLQRESESLANGEMPDLNVYEDHKAHIEAHLIALEGLYAELGLVLGDGFEAASAVVDQLLQENPEGGFDDILKIIKFLELHIEEHQTLLEENPKSGMLKYRSGWREIHTVQNLVLYDGEMIDEHDMIPLVPFYAYKDRPIFGYSEIRNIIDSQRMSAIMQFKTYKGLQKVANPAVILDKESGLTSEDITNEDGAVYEIAQGTNIRHLQPGSVSPQLGQFNDERSRKMQSISGVNEVTQGQVVNPNASGVTVQKTQNQAIGRMRLKDRQNQYYSMKRLGRIIASNIIQYWHSEKFLGFENGEAMFFNPIEMQDLDYSIEIAPGSMAGVDKESFNAISFNLLQAGHINFEQFLELAEMPKKEKLLENIKQNRDAQIEELQQENIILKRQFSPESMSPEELEIFKTLSQQMGPNQGQPIN